MVLIKINETKIEINENYSNISLDLIDSFFSFLLPLLLFIVFNYKNTFTSNTNGLSLT